MELKEFIKEIIGGISDAIDEINQERTIKVMPTNLGSKFDSIKCGNQELPVTKIKFSVALTISENNNVSGEAKGGLSLFSAKINAETKGENSTENRIEFELPVMFNPASQKKSSDTWKV